jgi:hypothetical protein
MKTRFFHSGKHKCSKQKRLRTTGKVINFFLAIKIKEKGTVLQYILSYAYRINSTGAAHHIDLWRGSDPDSSFHFNADPDPVPRQSDANLRQLKGSLFECQRPSWPHCEPLQLTIFFYFHPDSAFHSNADSDSASTNNAVTLRGSVSGSATLPRTNSQEDRASIYSQKCLAPP